MTAGQNKLARYRVLVMKIRHKHAFGLVPDDGIFVNEGDEFYGYGYPVHKVGKYFDMWFSNPKHNDPDNFITFGRIKRIQGNPYLKGMVYATKLGMFYVETA